MSNFRCGKCGLKNQLVDIYDCKKCKKQLCHNCVRRLSSKDMFFTFKDFRKLPCLSCGSSLQSLREPDQNRWI